MSVDQALPSVAKRRWTRPPQPRLLSYVQDKGATAARWRRRLAWAMLIVWAFFYGMLFAFLPPAFIPPLSVPLLLLAMLVVWALPTKDWVPLRTVRGLFLSVVTALIIWPNYLAVDLPGLPWITLTRLFIFPLTAIFLVSMSVSPTVREQLKEVIAANRTTVRLLLIFVVIMFISIGFSRSPVDSFEKFVIDQFYWTAMFFIACFLFRSPSLTTRWCGLLVALAVCVSLIAMWEWRLGRLPWVGHIPSFLHVADDSVMRSLAGQRRPGSSVLRLQSTFGESLGLAEYLALTSPLLMHFAVKARKLWLRLLAMMLIPFIFFTIMMTGARLGMMGFLVALILYTGAWALRRWKTDRQSILAPATLLAYPAFAGLLVAATFLSHRLHAMVWGTGNTQSSTDARIAQFHMGWPKVFQAPLGHGVAQSGDALGYANAQGVVTIDTYTLLLALDYGPLGLIVFYSFFATAIVPGAKIGLQSRNAESALLLPLSISLIVFLVVKTVYSSEATHAVPFMMMGAMCALIARHRADVADRGRRSKVLPS